MQRPRYTKPYLSLDEQLDLIESRGLNILDRTGARDNLERLGYYRLSGYWYPFRQRLAEHLEGTDTPEETFREGIWFEEIVAICEFDRRLRNLILAGTEPFEMAVRVAVARQVGSHGPFAYVDRNYWGDAATKFSNPRNEISDFDNFVQHQHELIVRSSEAFARHFLARYDGPMPIWTAIELWDFGMLTRFFEVLHEDDREQVAKAFGVAGGRRFQGWLRAINDLRNVCAHHGRLFKRHFPNNPGFPKDIDVLRHLTELDDQKKHRLYPMLCVLAFTLDQLPNCQTWKSQVSAHFDLLPEITIASADDFGIPDKWRTQKLWKQAD